MNEEPTRIPGARHPRLSRRLRAFVNRAVYAGFPAAIVLRYHRVCELPTDPNGTSVSPRRFRDQMAFLRENYSPVPLSALAGKEPNSPIPRRSVAVTFDDGYADNADFALPILEEFEIPATVFVTAGYVGSDREFWWDELNSLLLHPGRLPGVLELEETGIRGELGEDAEYSARDREAQGSWSRRSTTDPTRRHTLLRRLSTRLAAMSAEDREHTMERLREWAALDPETRPEHRPLDANRLRRLAESDLVEIGAHTMSHPRLPELNTEQQRREIEGGKQVLEELVGLSITSFAYPFGAVGRTARLVAEAGFDLACTTRPGLVLRQRPNHRVPRLYAGDWETEEFGPRLGLMLE